MTETARLPLMEPESINPYFRYEILEVRPHNHPLSIGPWACLYVGDFYGQSKSIGNIEVLYRLYCEGMDALVARLAESNIHGILGETRISETILTRLGYEVGYAGDHGRIAYMSIEKFFLKPWRVSLLQVRRGSA